MLGCSTQSPICNEHLTSPPSTHGTVSPSLQTHKHSISFSAHLGTGVGTSNAPWHLKVSAIATGNSNSNSNSSSATVYFLVLLKLLATFATRCFHRNWWYLHRCSPSQSTAAFECQDSALLLNAHCNILPTCNKYAIFFKLKYYNYVYMYLF